MRRLIDIAATVRTSLMRGRVGAIIRHQAVWLTAGYALSLLTIPVISRMAHPEDVGVWLFVASCVSIISPSSTFKMDVALLTDATEAQAMATARAGMAVLLPSALAGALVALGLVHVGQAHGLTPVHGVRLPSPGLIALAVCAGVGLAGAVQIGGALAVRRRSYAPSVESRTVQLVAMPLCQVLFLTRSMGYAGLILGDIAGRLAALCYLMAKDDSFRAVARGPWSLRALRETISSQQRFAKTASIASLFNSVCVQFPVVAMTLLYGTGASGLFGMAWRLLNLPQSIIGASIGQLILGETAHLVREQQRDLLARIYRTVLVLAVLSVIVGVLTGPPLGALAVWALGHRWEGAGAYIGVLLPAALVQTIVAPASGALNVFGGDRAQLGIDTTRLLAYGAVAVSAVYGLSVSGFAGSVAVVQAVFYLGTAALLVKLCPRPDGVVRLQP